MSAPRAIRGGLLLAALVLAFLLVHSALRRGGGARADGRIVLATYQVTGEYLPLERMGILEGLTRVGYEFEPPEPALAESFAHEGGGVWAFRLRPGLTFHDGTVLTAQEAVASIQGFLASALGAHVRDLLSVRARDERTVEVTAASPTLPVPGYMGRIPILAGASFGPCGTLVKPIGTGPFVAREIRFGRGATLVANPHWWGGTPGLQEIEVRVVKNPATRVLMLETGDADWIQMVPRHEVARLRDAGFGVHRSRYLYNVYLLFQCRRGPGSHAPLRRAAALAIDRERVARIAFEGTADAAASIFPGDRPFVPADLPYTACAPEEARRLLDEAGYRAGGDGLRRLPDGGALDVEILTVAESYRPAWSSAAELIRQDLETVGIGARVRVHEKGAWNARVRGGDFMATLRGRVPALWPDPLACLRFDFRTDGPANITGFADARFDALLDAGLGASTAAAREECVAAVQRFLAEELPVIPLVHDYGRETFAVRRGLLNAADPCSLRTGFPGPLVLEQELSDG